MRLDFATSSKSRTMRVLSLEDLRELGIPYHREHLRRLIEAGLFPPPMKLGEGPRSRNAWIESEVAAWIEARAAARPAPGKSALPSNRVSRGQAVAKFGPPQKLAAHENWRNRDISDS